MNTLRKILVVDDDPVVGKSFDHVLSSKGYAVVTAADGAEALRKIAAEEYDLVFTDIKMPGMDGLAVAQHIRDHQPWLPVVIVSGYATQENEARAMAAGVSAVLHKPLSPEMIEDSARTALLPRPAVAAGTLVEQAAAEVTVMGVAPSPARLTAADIGKRLMLVAGAPFLGLAFVLVLPFAGIVTLCAVPLLHGGRMIGRRTRQIEV
jgi:CheY-like chemotaxis protein